MTDKTTTPDPTAMTAAGLADEIMSTLALRELPDGTWQARVGSGPGCGAQFSGRTEGAVIAAAQGWARGYVDAAEHIFRSLGEGAAKELAAAAATAALGRIYGQVH